MNLSKLLSKRIPTILGLLFLGAGLAVGIYLLGTGTGGFFPRASPETTPKQMKITNVSNDSFTVSFLTDSATPGFIKYSTDQNRLSSQAGDDRDQLSGTVGQFTTHHITVRGLEPSATYYFSIGTANKYAYTDNGKPYSVTTAPKIGGAPNALTAYGTVVTSGSSPAKDSIVYITIDGSTPLSTLVKSSGSYAISLALARTPDLASFADFAESSNVNIFVQGKEATLVSNATAIVKNTQPVPTITLGQNHDFTTGGDLTETPPETDFSQTPLNPAVETDLSSTASGTVSQNAAGDIVFSNPAVEGAEVESPQPVIAGTAPAFTTLTVTVHSTQEFTDTVQSDGNGNWSYTPPDNLEPGSHTVTVSYKDATGATKTQQRTFIVAATATTTTSGKASLPVVTATPSATPKATPKPSPTATASARVTQPSTSSGVPASGSVEQTYGLLLAGLTLLAAGFVLWHKTAKLEQELD